jgi:hypothetical protein
MESFLFVTVKNGSRGEYFLFHGWILFDVYLWVDDLGLYYGNRRNGIVGRRRRKDVAVFGTRSGGGGGKSRVSSGRHCGGNGGV